MADWASQVKVTDGNLLHSGSYHTAEDKVYLCDSKVHFGPQPTKWGQLHVGGF